MLRKVTSSSRNARPRTNANTNGRRLSILSLKSFEPAVMPVTLVSVPATLPIVAGIVVSRSVTSAASERSSVPLPGSGRETIATGLSGLTVVLVGPRAVAVSSSMPFVHRRGGDVVGLDDGERRAAGRRGTSAWMRS